MKLNEIADNPGASRSRTRIGRGIGSGLGKTAGRGVKGQKSRSGVAIKAFEGGQMPLHMRMPKRGFNNAFAKRYNAVRLDRIQTYIDSGKLKTSGVVDAQALKDAGVIRQVKDGVRLINGGTFSAKNVSFKVDHVSAGAKAAVESAGGSVETPKAAE